MKRFLLSAASARTKEWYRFWVRVSFVGDCFAAGCVSRWCAIVMVIDLWSGLSVTLSVADAQMIGAIYGVKQALRWVCFRPQPGEASPLVAGFPFLGVSGSVYARCVGGRLRSVCCRALPDRCMGEAKCCYGSIKVHVGWPCAPACVPACWDFA